MSTLQEPHRKNIVSKRDHLIWPIF